MRKTYKYIFYGIIAVMMVVYLTCDVLSLWDSRTLKFITSALITLFGLSVFNKKRRQICKYRSYVYLTG